MIVVENISVYNIARAVYSARNAMNSWDKSDSDICKDILGANDLKLAKKLYKAGSEHRKYLRQIFVSMDIIAPLYFWKEMDQYKVGVTTDSCSTMHSVHKRDLTLDDFSHEHLSDIGLELLISTIEWLNNNRTAFTTYIDDYGRSKKDYWYEMIQLLPSSYNQKRTVTMNYENVVNIIRQRSGHKLEEWEAFILILKELPYIKEIME